MYLKSLDNSTFHKFVKNENHFRVINLLKETDYDINTIKFLNPL